MHTNTQTAINLPRLTDIHIHTQVWTCIAGHLPLLLPFHPAAAMWDSMGQTPTLPVKPRSSFCVSMTHCGASGELCRAC